MWRICPILLYNYFAFYKMILPSLIEVFSIDLEAKAMEILTTTGEHRYLTEQSCS